MRRAVTSVASFRGRTSGETGVWAHGHTGTQLTHILNQVIVTSFLFPDAKFSEERLAAMSQLVGKDKLVVDIR
jgi:hypothetical protein